ncbi:malate/lactate/ureidoglycolate dehydrogenase [Raoultella terrigena]|uniref:malate/lactate/ureidoglycolate dehydrogenase n=1 Tax=Raoultella terrigena TaxID=577 RepID=UPI0005F86CC6|nr:malate/lactate/ureidoglycolate dehydrogenase [Raoultella terrigena]
MPLLSHTFLRDYLSQHLLRVNVAAEVASVVANNLVEASLKGHDSHGVTLLPRYIEAIRVGELDPQATLRLTRDEGALLSFQGDRGFGQVLGREAMIHGIERARQFGVAVVGLAQSHHLGRIGEFAEQIADAGLISIHFANVASRPVVLPFNGLSPRFGTNPFCVGIPVEDQPPLILDFATSMIAGNKARIAWNEGRTIPPGCAVDNEGNPTEDPRWLVQEPFGSLLAFGGHKGAGLALVCSLLGAALTGGESERLKKSKGAGVVNSMLSLIINPELLGGGPEWQQELIAQLQWTREGHGERDVLLPGEAERRHQQQRLVDGIDVDDVSWRQFLALENASRPEVSHF